MKLGPVEFSKSVDRLKFVKQVKGLDLKPPVVIKPNWGYSGCFTEADILDWAFSAIKGDKLVVEGYGWARTKDFVTSGRMGSKRKSDLRKSDKWFLDYSGIGKVLEEHSIEFLNVTEENWAKRTADPEEIRTIVEKHYDPVAIESMYANVPQQLYEMRGSSFLSLAKLRLGSPPYQVSLAVKNLFGLIPGPGRYVPYHGKKNVNLSQSVLDINKIYHSLFNVKGIVDAVLTADSTLGGRKGGIYKDSGLLWSCSNVFELDACVSAQFGQNPLEVDYLRHTAEHMGMWSNKIVEVGLENRVDHILHGE